MSAKAPDEGTPTADQPVELKQFLSSLNRGDLTHTLGELLKSHPELEAEVREIALKKVESIDAKRKSGFVLGALEGVDSDDMERTAHERGRDYAWLMEQALEEALHPYQQDIDRRVDLGSHKSAWQVCEAVIIALYETLHSDDRFLKMWEDHVIEERAIMFIGELPLELGEELPQKILDAAPDWASILKSTARERSW